jgi:hypothetical protein
MSKFVISHRGKQYYGQIIDIKQYIQNMKIFSTEPAGNEIAEYVGVEYLKFSISMIENDVEWLKNNNKIAQPLLANIDMLLTIASKYPVDDNLLIKKDKVQEWKQVFNDWFKRCGNKIPTKYKDEIKSNGDELFKELEQYGH